MDAAELKRAREALGLTQAELAAALGVAPNTLARWERGTLKIRHPGFVELALERVRADSGATPRRPNPDHNLPEELNSFFGRERDERDLAILLGSTRLLTLTGPGGVGKTRLAQRVARAVLSQYSGGVWFVDLASITDPGLVTHSVSAILRRRDLPRRHVTSPAAGVVAKEPTLLLMDNCEHLIQACASLVSDLLQSTPDLRILATSREPLGVAGETVRRLAPLESPDPHQVQTPDQLLDYAAVQLLLDRAAAHGADISATDAGLALASICGRLDGLPLAIELAAARLPALGPASLARELDDALHVLAGSRRDVPARHTTLWATIDWSYALLSAAERQLFNTLAIFAGGWSLEACEAIATGDGIHRYDVVDVLGGLVAKSLVVAEPGAGGTVRYRMMDTLRQYAWKQLEQTGRADVLRARHSDWFVDQADRAMQAARGPTEAQEFARLEADLANLRIALDLVVSGPNMSERNAGVAARLWWFWQMNGHYREGREYLERLIAHSRETLSPATRADVLHGAAMLAWNQRYPADLEVSRRYHEDALAIRRALGDATAIGRSLGGLARTLRDLGDSETARQLLEDLVQLQEAAGDRFGVARTLNALGLSALGRHDFPLAMEYFAKSLDVSRELQDPSGIATEVGNMASLAYEQGDLQWAEALSREALAMRRDLGGRWSLFAIFDVMAGLAARRNQPQRAARLFGASDRVRYEAGQTLERRPPFGRARYLDDIATAGSKLGMTEFETARAAGRAMSVEDAIAEAFDDSCVTRMKTPGLALTPRETQVAELVARGLTNRQIADELIVTEGTAAKHVENIRAKLGVTSRTQIVRRLSEASRA
jgi:predicted ATPase/DNA-binding CsgD family transcriptional regulator/DNA-binding XRE family transcriptional regulator